ncbi:2-hydroxychromene-2-carboxylate isomerase [Nocardiopsis protaetiae]|uniref:2-hydroxychromene-2-carboxylate isomerase n=1 Tax=Nocardiopsis protaetiae TaxID=3382270 RepID=UPI00387AA8F1
MKRPPRLYFAFRSPFSWMALRRLEELYPQAADTVEFRPFWEPDEDLLARLRAGGGEFPYTPMSKAKHLYILYDTKRLAASLGYTMSWPVDVDPWWEVPHLAWLYARRQGREREFYRLVTEARWERGENVCDPALVRELAAEAGLDGDAAASAASDPDLREEALAALHDLYQDDVFGVPYFRVGRHRFWGLDRLAAFLDVLDPREGDAARDGDARELPALARVPVPAGAGVPDAVPLDSDSAGGCG